MLKWLKSSLETKATNLVEDPILPEISTLKDVPASPAKPWYITAGNPPAYVNAATKVIKQVKANVLPAKASKGKVKK